LLTITVTLVAQIKATGYLLIVVIEEKCIEAFFDWPNLLTEQMHDIKKIWVHLEASKQFSKMLFAYLKTAPCVALVQETRTIFSF
jgi:hypothetical protein